MTQARAELCTICGRVAFGDLVLLSLIEREGGTLRAWRHDSCAVGSEEWAVYYRALPTVERAKLAEFYRYFIGVSIHYNQQEG
jgi:hypothetical protein